MNDKEILKAKVMKLRESPELFLTKILGEDSLEEYHKTICADIVKYDRVAIPACHAVGKTWICGRIVLWFINCFKNSIVITTAPTNRQVETLLWGEIRKAHKRSKTRLGGKLLNKKLTIDDDWYAMGFSPTTGAASDSEEQQGSAFQGFHAKHIMVIFDEATGIPRDLYTMAEGLLTSGITVKWICIANPTSTSSEFFRICKKAEWFVRKINCFDSPNMIANGFVDRKSLEIEIQTLETMEDEERLLRIKNYKKPNGYLLSAQWAVAKVLDWGFNHPLALSKILGEFPTASDNVIVKYDSVLAAINREDVKVLEKRSIGVDVARFGDDKTVLTDFRGNELIAKEVFHQQDLNDTTGCTVKLIKDNDYGLETHVVVDATGVGSGVYDNLVELKRLGELNQNIFIHEVHFAEKIQMTKIKESDKSEKQKKKEKQLNDTYENLKAYIFDLLNKDLKDVLSIPDEEIFEEELPTIMFKYSKKGRLVVENKIEYKARIGKSPDTADSMALANWGRHLKPNHMEFKKRKPAAKPFKQNYEKRTKRYKPTKNRIKPKTY